MTKFILSLWHADGSGTVQVFGPYDTAAMAGQVRDRLAAWPSIPYTRWTVDTVERTSGSPGTDVLEEEVGPANGWTPQMAADIRKRFVNNEACQHCKGLHARACPRVKSMTFHNNGSLASIEFWQDGEWSDNNVIWPEEVPDISSAEDSS